MTKTMTKTMTNKVIKQDTFVFFRSFYEAGQDLDDKSRLAFYDAIANYALNHTEPTLQGIEKTCFTLIKPNLLNSKNQYLNGKKGGRPMTNNPPLEMTKTYKDKDKDKDKDKKTAKAIFEKFRKSYRGSKRGLETEFVNFKKKHKDWREVLKVLPTTDVSFSGVAQKFIPHFQTYINQRRWEQEISGTDLSSEVYPQ